MLKGQLQRPGGARLIARAIGARAGSRRCGGRGALGGEFNLERAYRSSPLKPRAVLRDLGGNVGIGSMVAALAPHNEPTRNSS